MSDWKTIDSPRLRVPMELREVSTASDPEREWEVQELRGGSMFQVRYRPAAERGAKRPSEAVLEHAVCVAVEESMLTPPDKEPGETYEVHVQDEHLEAAGKVG